MYSAMLSCAMLVAKMGCGASSGAPEPGKGEDVPQPKPEAKPEATGDGMIKSPQGTLGKPMIFLYFFDFELNIWVFG